MSKLKYGNTWETEKHSVVCSVILHSHKKCTIHIHAERRGKKMHQTASECAATQKFNRVMGEHEKNGLLDSRRTILKIMTWICTVSRLLAHICCDTTLQYTIKWTSKKRLRKHHYMRSLFLCISETTTTDCSIFFLILAAFKKFINSSEILHL